MATIRINGLCAQAIIGTREEERESPQEIFLDIEIEFDESKALKSDNLGDTVDYQAIKRKVMAFVENSRYHLVEKLASEVLNLIMEDKKILFARICVEKPHALRFVRSVSLELKKSNPRQ